jgi:erythromycin esterase-like protein
LPAKLSSRYQPFPGEAALLPQLLRVAEQFSLYHTLAASLRPSYRAACLAENLQWARQQAAGGKAVVWSHNESLATYNRDDETLGMQLRRQYGADFLAVGLAFHEGTFRALRAEEPPAFVTATAAPSAVGSYEHYFRAAALPAALLDIRTPDLMPGTQWLFENLQFREGTLKAYTQPFDSHSLRREFDALFYLPKSTPAQGAR